jgi:DNA ligase-1
MASKSINITDYKKDLPGKIVDDITYAFPQVESITSSGKKLQWRIIIRIVKGNNDFQIIKLEYFSGQLAPEYSGWINVISKAGDDGKVRNSTPTIITEGKNLGKSNETNVFTQALRDAYGLYNKQAAKSTEDNDLFPPMLAQRLDAQTTPPDFTAEVFIQRKFNGVRVVAGVVKDVIMYSRTRKLYKGFEDIKQEIKIIIDKFNNDNPEKHLYLDGELYKHGMSLQDISGMARRGEKKAGQLQYYVYDCFVIENHTLAGLKFGERNKIIEKYIPKSTTHIVPVETFRVNSLDEANNYYNKFIKENYEGAIVRLNTPYQFSYNSYHSPSLLKMKPAFDDEFKIVGYSAGEKGKAKDAIMFELETNAGKRFTVTPGLTLEERKQLYKRMPADFDTKYKGKLLTVTYDELSKDGIPSRARTEGIVIRDYE